MEALDQRRAIMNAKNYKEYYQLYNKYRGEKKQKN